MRIGPSLIAGITAVIVTVAGSPAISGQKPGVPAVPSLPMGKAEDVGMSSQRLARIGTAMQRYVDRKEIAGAVTLVARRGRVVHLAAYGHRDVASASAMTPDAIFRIRSMTKPIVTAALMTLHEEGRFLLSDPISRWMPEFGATRVADSAKQSGPITVGHLLTHTSGLASDTSGTTAPAFQKIRPQSVPNDTLAAFAARLSTLPLSFEPGTAWNYGFSTDIAGRLIEILSGQSLDRFVAARILQPLQMNNTHFYVPLSKLNRLASVYRRSPAQTLEAAETASADSPYVRAGTYLSATSGLSSTADDYFRFHQMMLNGGELNGMRILGRKTVELMTTNHTGDLFRIAKGMTFGLGYAIVEDVGATGLAGSAGMYTWPGSMTTTSFADPTEELIGVMMIQLQPRSATITNEFQSLVYQAIVDRPR
jgi:CubicO group peptidase (beta-lactamase class C family)